ncbi:hypothetical protein Bsel_2299 [[Bacillus] selenitireducens MLS10]|uniref:Uncharacterized protein n=1 Tax=Bacillus selenitireducens (strain ATCC 700615 / DSM 15326 / MLS10) TaxID=439292 RepID=D6XW48_BACIE|nr:hypothetical protein Bsel_2299 [[Bacillus] selenitireducens MLS10]
MVIRGVNQVSMNDIGEGELPKIIVLLMSLL